MVLRVSSVRFGSDRLIWSESSLIKALSNYYTLETDHIVLFNLYLFCNKQKRPLSIQLQRYVEI